MSDHRQVTAVSDSVIVRIEGASASAQQIYFTLLVLYTAPPTLWWRWRGGGVFVVRDTPPIFAAAE